MPLKKSRGNMYDWVSHTHSHLGGECPHKCSYCYVQRNRFGVSERYKGNVRLIEKELAVNYGSGKTIFIEHMNDMFAIGVQDDWIDKILTHCKAFPKNKYVFQTKNTQKAFVWLENFPHDFMIGTTIESNRAYRAISKAPDPFFRFTGMERFVGSEIFVTIEPILDFDLQIMFNWLSAIKPSFVNIGADSKRCGLPEPSDDKIKALVAGLQERNITIKKKVNLERIFK